LKGGGGWRIWRERGSEITGQRIRKDWAEQRRSLADKDFPDAEKIIPVMDNANQRFETTHSTASRYEPFPADDAKRKKDGDTLYAQTREQTNHAEIEMNVINN
jgi:phosphoglycerol transferase MdoB-like AlkP superfamily enzyme